MSKLVSENPNAFRKPTVMVVADSGGGKTSLLASLAKHGFKVNIFDWDNGTEILHDPAILPPELRQQVSVMHLDADTEEGTAWTRFNKVLRDGWVDEDENLGKLSEWDSNTVICIDTLTSMGKAAMRQTLTEARRDPYSQPEIQHYGDAFRKLENKISWLISRNIRAPLVVNTHLRAIEDDLGRTRFYPSTIGSSLSTIIARYFNTVVRIDRKPAKAGGFDLVLRTTGDNKMDLKTSIPSKVKTEEEFDLGKMMRAMLDAG